MNKLFKTKIIKIIYFISIILTLYFLMFVPKATSTIIGDYIFSKVYSGGFSKIFNQRDYYYQKCFFVKNMNNYECKGRYNIIEFNGLKAASFWEIEKPDSKNMLAYLQIKEELKKFNENNKDFKYVFKQETLQDNILYIKKITENIIKILFVITVFIAWLARNHFLHFFLFIENKIKKLIKKIYNFI